MCVYCYFHIETTVFKKDASNGLSYEKLLYNVNKSHPRLITKDSSNNSHLHIIQC